MELWRKNFHDSEDFVRFYFDRKYSDENSLVYEENGKALSALLFLPYPMNWQNTTIPTSYISGACTLPEARNRGLMTMLLQEAFTEMYERKITLSTLIPAEEWLFGYYAALGYASVFDYTTCQIKAKSISADRSSVIAPAHYDAAFAMHYFPYFQRQMQKRSCCILHSPEDYLAIVEETYLSGGRLLITHRGNPEEPSGWALALPHQGEICIKEIFYNSPCDQAALIYACEQIGKSAPITVKYPPDGSNDKKYGMARIIDAFGMLSHMASLYPGITLTLKLNDPQLTANEGIYLLQKGECKKWNEQIKNVDIETDIPTLTKVLLGYHIDQLPQSFSELLFSQQPYMNLMLD